MGMVRLWNASDVKLITLEVGVGYKMGITVLNGKK